MEQVIKILNEAFLPENLECDGPRICMGCWKDKVRGAIKLLEEMKPKDATDLESEYDILFGNPDCFRWNNDNIEL